VNTGKSVISSAYPDIWQLIMGGLFIGVVLIFPKGIVGSLIALLKRVGRPASSPEPVTTAAALPAELEVDGVVSQ
jgi:hypothetical protein